MKQVLKYLQTIFVYFGFLILLFPVVLIIITDTEKNKSVDSNSMLVGEKKITSPIYFHPVAEEEKEKLNKTSVLNSIQKENPESQDFITKKYALSQVEGIIRNRNLGEFDAKEIEIIVESNLVMKGGFFVMEPYVSVSLLNKELDKKFGKVSR